MASSSPFGSSASAWDPNIFNQILDIVWWRGGDQCGCYAKGTRDPHEDKANAFGRDAEPVLVSRTAHELEVHNVGSSGDHAEDHRDDCAFAVHTLPEDPDKYRD